VTDIQLLERYIIFGGGWQLLAVAFLCLIGMTRSIWDMYLNYIEGYDWTNEDDE
jgi:hypothetical protein